MLVSIHSRLNFVIAFLGLFGAASALAPVTSFAQDSTALPGGVSAMVNGRPIATEMIDTVERQLSQDDAPSNREDILNELINLEILTQRAEMQKLEAKPDVAASLRLQYAQTMANAYLESLSSELVVNDEQVRAEYDKQVELLDHPEYRASHILLDSEKEAMDIVAALNANGDFAQLAQEFSTGPSASKGGDLGWFDNNTMMAEFTAAVAQLELNEFSKVPVQTQFGWHVIKLIDKRSGSVPDFEAVKSGIRNLMIQNLLTERIEALREQSDINTGQ